MITDKDIQDALALSELARTAPPETVAKAILMTMHKQRILGGIASLECLVNSMPAKILELPAEQRQVLAAIVTVVDNFTAKLKESL